MANAATPLAPRHPHLGERSLIAWPGYHSGLSIGSFDRAVVGAIAKPLCHALRDYALVAAALDAEMGVALPTQSWRNQLSRKHPKRTGTFAELKVSRPRLEFDPEEGRLRPSFAERYAQDDLEDQLEAGATLVTTAAHALEREVGDGRHNDLLLARLAAEEFAARRASSPAPGRRGRRELFTTLIVQGRHAADPEIVDWLVAAYAGLEGVDGFWILAANTHNSGKQLAGFVRLALRLEAVAERPTVTSAVGDAHLALLASGVSATCAGLHGMSFRFPPQDLPVSDGENEDEPGLGVHTYHPAVLGNAGQLGVKGDRIRLALFKTSPCPCGHHEPDRPPTTKAQIVAHNSWARQTDARLFAEPRVEAAEVRLAARAAQARRSRRLLGMSRLHSGFGTVPTEAARLRQQERLANADR